MQEIRNNTPMPSQQLPAENSQKIPSNCESATEQSDMSTVTPTTYPEANTQSPGAPQRMRRASPRLPTTLLLVGLLLFGLGAGNLWYGRDRGGRYTQLLEEALHTQSAPPPNFNREQHQRYVRRLEARLGFFRTTVIGGATFIVVGITLSGLGWLLWARQSSN